MIGEENRFSAVELEELANLLAPKIAALLPAHVCQFEAKDVKELQNIAAAARTAKNTAFATFIGAVVIFLLGALGYGLASKIRGGGVK